MPAQHRQKRLPISCEPCRIRKIRCSRPRGPPPCETCVRRALVSDCTYAGRGAATSSPARPCPPPTPPSEQSTTSKTSPPPGESLLARVARLEALLQAQAQDADEQTPPTVRPGLPSPTNDKGLLAYSESGHVRFIASPLPPDHAQPLSNPQQATAGSIDLSDGPYPLGMKQVATHDLLLDLPARNHCQLLKSVFFDSFASVRQTPPSQNQSRQLTKASYSTSCTTQLLMSNMPSSSEPLRQCLPHG